MPEPRRLGFLRAHLESEQTTHGIYGTIVVLAVIVALEGHPPSGQAILASVLGAVVAVILAEIYADYIGTMIREHHRPERAEWRRIVVNTLGNLIATALPIFLLTLGVAGVIRLEAGFTAAKWAGAAVIAAYAFIANRLSGLSLGRSILASAAFGLIGLGLVLFKQYFH